MANEFENMLADYVLLLQERAGEASAGKDVDRFQLGRQFGIYESLSLLKAQSEAFGIGLERVGLASFDPDLDVL